MKRQKENLASDAMGTLVRETLKPETLSDLRAVFSERARPKNWTVADDIAEIKERVDASLVGLGWPPSQARLAVKPNGEWRIASGASDIGEGEEFTWAFLWIARNAPPLSEAYWLGRMAFSLRGAEDHLASGDMRSFFSCAMQIGAFANEIELRHRSLRFAETGKKTHENNAKNAKANVANSFAARHGDAAQLRASELYREKPSRTWGRIREILAEEFDVSAETIKKQIRNPKKLG